MEIEFFDDIVTFAKNLSRLPDKFLDILKFGEATNLMHNRIMSQIIYEYYCLGFNITPLPHKHTGEKIYDFDVRGFNTEYKCEVKTLQSVGNLEKTSTGAIRLTEESYKSIMSSIRDKLEDAKKAGPNGIIIMAFSSYKINALLRKYFEKDLLIYPPPPFPNMTILVITSDDVFQDYYTILHTDRALSILENVFSNIQNEGVFGLSQVFIRRGLTLQLRSCSKKRLFCWLFFSSSPQSLGIITPRYYSPSHCSDFDCVILSKKLIVTTKIAMSHKRTRAFCNYSSSYQLINIDKGNWNEVTIILDLPDFFIIYVLENSCNC